MPIINIKPHPFKQARQQIRVREGCTLHQLLPKDRSWFHVSVNGKQADLLYPLHEKDVVDIAILPKGTEQQSAGEKALTAGIQILTTAIVTVATGGNLLAGLQTGAIIAGLTIAGNFAMSKLDKGPGERDSFNRLSSLTGSRNRVNPYGVIPRVYGHRKIYPPIAGKPFTEVIGSDQYLRVLYCLGYGPVIPSNVKIGDTEVGSVSFNQSNGVYEFSSNGNYEDLELEFGSAPSLYANDVDEIAPAEEFTDVGIVCR